MIHRAFCKAPAQKAPLLPCKNRGLSTSDFPGWASGPGLRAAPRKGLVGPGSYVLLGIPRELEL